MNDVIELGLALTGVVEGKHYGARAVKLNGRMLACTPVNKSAEVNSAAVAIGFEQRAALLEAHPAFYYITDHYAAYPILLIRLSKITRTHLERTLRMAWDFVASDGAPAPARRAVKPGRAKRTRTRSA